MSVNESLAHNRYHPADFSHIVLSETITDAQCDLLEKMCPAGLFQRNGNGQLTFQYQGCLECGCCRLITAGEIIVKWQFPPSGSGIALRFG